MIFLFYFSGKMNYFYETNPVQGLKLGYEVKKKVYSKKTKSHKIDIFQNDALGKVFALDGKVKFNENYEFILHEMMSHLPIFSHPNPERVLIIGANAGGILREAIKHEKITEIYLVDYDKDMIEASKKHLAFLEFPKSLQDKRVKISEEGINEFINKFEDYFDIIIFSDTPDEELIKASSRALTREGIVIIREKEFKKELKRHFKQFQIIRSGPEAFILLSKKLNLSEINFRTLNVRFKQFKQGKKLKYYSPEIHMSATIIPRFY